MKKITFLFLIITFIACENKTENKQGLSKELDTVSQNIDDYFIALTQLKKFNGVVAIFKKDSFALEKAYNLHESPDNSTYVSLEHQFDIHSISKLMSYYLIIKLEAEGKISKYQTIDQFYPDFPKGEQITIEMLLEHQSGLPRELLGLEGNEFDLTSEEIIALAKKQQLLFEPGSDVQYSNVGYEVVHDILSKIYEKPFAQCMVDEIFVPLNMTKSGAHFFTQENRLQQLAKNHSLKDSTIVQVPNILEEEFKTARLYSTVSDLNLFLDEVSKEPYASSLKDENEVIAKDGGSDGIRAQIYTNLAKDFRFVLLANYDEMPFFKTIEDVVKILNSEPFELPKELNRQAIELNEEILEKYVGAYTFADFDGLVLRIAIEDHQLVVFQEDEKIGTLKAETETIFFEDPKAPESFEFIENDSGTYNTLMGWKGIAVEGKRIK